MERVCNKGKRRLGKDLRGVRAQGEQDSPRKRTTIDRDKVALRELYHNPDPIFRLIGTANETDVIIEDQTVKGLIDSGAQISSISDTFASKLGLKIKQLDTLLDLEPTGGGQVPYHGYVELRMRVPNVRAFDLDVLMLVIPESEYSRGVPITIGTIHIDEIIDLITDEELKAANRQWQRGIISRKVVVKQLQVKENKNVLDQVKGDVKLTLKIVIPPLETISVSGMTNINKHSKRVNIITEPREDGDLFTVPCYSYMRPGSKRATVTLRNLLEKPQTLLKGAVIAQVQPANIIPPKLAPRVTNVNNNNDKDSQDPSPERIEKLFSKLDLSGAEEWEETDRLKLKETICQVPSHIRFRRHGIRED